MKKLNLGISIFILAILACNTPSAMPNLATRSFSVKIKTPLPNSIYYVGRVVGITAEIPVFSTGNNLNTQPRENDRFVVGWAAFYANENFIGVMAPGYSSTAKKGYFFADQNFIPRTPGEYVIRVEVGRTNNDPNPVSATVKICVLDEANPNTSLCPTITGTPQRLEAVTPSSTAEPPILIEITPSATLHVIQPTKKPKNDDNNDNNGGDSGGAPAPASCGSYTDYGACVAAGCIWDGGACR